MKSKVFSFTLLLLLIISCLIFDSSSIIASVDPVGTWGNTLPLGYKVASHVSFIDNSNSFINIIAGADDYTFSNISSAVLGQNGSLSHWEISNLHYPKSIAWHASTTKNNNIYVLGGVFYPPLISTNIVYKGNLLNGKLISWDLLQNIPEKRSRGAATTSGNHIYYSGGFNVTEGNFIYSDKVFVAEIYPDGNLGSWTETQPLPLNLEGHGMVASDSKVVVFGGYSGGSVRNKVYEAEILPNGNLGSWVEKSPLPKPTFRSGYIKSGNLVISVGGSIDQSFGAFSDVFYAYFDENGSIGEWHTSSNPLPDALYAGSLAASDKYIYYTGGHDGSSYYNTVYYAPINSVFSEILNVPDIKQYANTWGTHLYDSANAWSQNNPTISRWGCAMTSAAMILQYYGFQTDPDELNTWLKENNGYTKNGGILWPAISKYSKDHSGGVKPTLEFTYHSPNPDFIKSEIENDRPPILKMQKANGDTHFMVAKGNKDNDFIINDPATPTNQINLLSQALNKWGQNIKIGKFHPSQTDLSYIVLFINDNFDLKVFDPQKNEITEGFDVEGPIVAADDETKNSGLKLKAFYLPKPDSGVYLIEVIGLGRYELDSYIFDKEGDYIKQTFENILVNNQSGMVQIDFKKDNIVETLSYEITFNSLKNIWLQASQKDDVKNNGLYVSVKEQLNNAEKQFTFGNIEVSQLHLKIAKFDIEKAHEKSIESNFANDFSNKLMLLSESLN